MNVAASCLITGTTLGPRAYHIKTPPVKPHGHDETDAASFVLPQVEKNGGRHICSKPGPVGQYAKPRSSSSCGPHPTAHGAHWPFLKASLNCDSRTTARLFGALTTSTSGLLVTPHSNGASTGM